MPLSNNIYLPKKNLHYKFMEEEPAGARGEKMGSNIPELTVGSSGKTIPLVGFGTAEFPLGASPGTMKESILHAMKLGYRHFDSAAIYQSEQIIGEAIDDALRLGFIKSRDELFITSKLWCSNAHPHLVLPALRQTLK
jgi:diketogulonate reductase-like aldo/keto reductase